MLSFIKNHYLKILIAVTAIASWYFTSLYYQNEIKDMQLEAERAKRAAVERAIEQHNEVAQLDQAVMRSYIDGLDKQDRHYENITEKIDDVKTTSDCSNPDLVRALVGLWNEANYRGTDETGPPGTHGLYEVVPANARLSALDLRRHATGPQGSNRQPPDKRRSLYDLR